MRDEGHALGQCDGALHRTRRSRHASGPHCPGGRAIDRGDRAYRCHSVNSRVGRRWAIRPSTSSRRCRAHAPAGSGWIMLKVADSAASEYRFAGWQRRWHRSPFRVSRPAWHQARTGHVVLRGSEPGRLHRGKRRHRIGAGKCLGENADLHQSPPRHRERNAPAAFGPNGRSPPCRARIARHPWHRHRSSARHQNGRGESFKLPR